jgi:hypothetical protein
MTKTLQVTSSQALWISMKSSSSPSGHTKECVMEMRAREKYGIPRLALVRDAAWARSE